LYSLLKNKKAETVYDIYALTSNKDVHSIFNEQRLYSEFKNFTITFIFLGDAFKDAYEIRNISIAAYYRLLIPELLPNLHKAIYMDVDIIIQSDLTKIYEIDLTNNYVAGFLDYGMSRTSSGQRYIHRTLGISTGKYIQSGFLLMNLSKLNKDRIVDQMRHLAKNKYILQDQDIINIACAGYTSVLPVKHNIILQFYDMLRDYPEDFAEIDLSHILNTAIIHYNGPKPWNVPTLNDDIWWEYYRKSPYFDFEFYKKHQAAKNSRKPTIASRIKHKMRNLIKQ